MWNGGNIGPMGGLHGSNLFEMRRKKKQIKQTHSRGKVVLKGRR